MLGGLSSAMCLLIFVVTQDLAADRLSKESSACCAFCPARVWPQLQPLTLSMHATTTDSLSQYLSPVCDVQPWLDLVNLFVLTPGLLLAPGQLARLTKLFSSQSCELAGQLESTLP